MTKPPSQQKPPQRSNIIYEDPAPIGNPLAPLKPLLDFFKDLAGNIVDRVEQTDEQIEREHQQTITEMLADYLHKQLGEVDGARHARLLSEALLGFRPAPVEPDLAALFTLTREALLKVDLLYTRQGSSFEVCMRLFVSELSAEGKRVLKQVRLKRFAKYEEVPQVIRFGVMEAEANGAPLSVTLLSPSPT